MQFAYNCKLLEAIRIRMSGIILQCDTWFVIHKLTAHQYLTNYYALAIYTPVIYHTSNYIPQYIQPVNTKHVSQ